MVPIYLPPVVVSHEVLDEEKAIIAEEGWFHVAGRYYRSAPDADKMRRLEAERRVERARRVKTAAARGATVAEPPALIPLEQTLRKSIELGRIQDDDTVEWGEWIYQDTPNERFARELVRWGDLSVYERHTVEFVEGKLVGGFPI